MEVSKLTERIGDSMGLFRAQWGIWRLHNVRGELDRAVAIAQDMKQRAIQEGNQDFLVQAHHTLWSSYLFRGDLDKTREHIQAALEIYDTNRHGGHAAIYGGHDPAECGMTQCGNAHFFMGFPDQGFEWNKRGLNHALSLGQPQVIAHAQNWGLLLLQLGDHLDELESRIDSIKPMVEEYGLAIYYTEARMVEAWLAVRRHGDRQAASTIHEQLDRRSAMGTNFCQTYFFVLVADAHLRLGEPRQALDVIEEGLRRAEATGEHFCTAELLRLKGRALLDVDARDPEVAIVAFDAAMADARGRGARMFELRAARDLARYWGECGERQKGYDLLNPLYDWFTEGFDTQDLKVASSLLSELR
jgi:adenylate cyclase